jgi:hypothetical protein
MELGFDMSSQKTKLRRLKSGKRAGQEAGATHSIVQDKSENTTEEFHDWNVVEQRLVGITRDDAY